MGMPRHRHELPGAAGLSGEAGHRHPGPDLHHDGSGSRSRTPLPRHSTPGEGPGRHLRRRALACRSSTDTCAAQRALGDRRRGGAHGQRVSTASTTPIRAPIRTPSCSRSLSPADVLARGLKVADATAISLCQDNHLPIVVFNLLVDGNIARAVAGERIGTLVSTSVGPVGGRRATDPKSPNQPQHPDLSQRSTANARPAPPSAPKEPRNERRIGLDRRNPVGSRREDGQGHRGDWPARTSPPFGPAVTPAMFNKLMVDYYGAPTPLNQLASFQVPEARMIIVTPHDRSSMTAIEKAIRDSDLGVNPNDDGHIIRVVLPALTEDRAANTSRWPVARPRTPRSRSATFAGKPRSGWRRCRATAMPAGRRPPRGRVPGGRHEHACGACGRHFEGQGSRAARGLTR